MGHLFPEALPAAFCSCALVGHPARSSEAEKTEELPKEEEKTEELPKETEETIEQVD